MLFERGRERLAKLDTIKGIRRMLPIQALLIQHVGQDSMYYPDNNNESINKES